MSISRRGFLSVLGAGLAGAAIDPEKLLWTPDKKLISIPKRVIQTSQFSIGDIITMDGFYKVNPVTRKSTRQLMEFVITGYSSGAPTFYPAALDKGPWQNIVIDWTVKPEIRPYLRGRTVGSSSNAA